MSINIGIWQREDYKKTPAANEQGNHKVVDAGPKEWKDPNLVIQERLMAEMMVAFKSA